MKYLFVINTLMRAGWRNMIKINNNRAWFLVMPALAVISFSAIIPLMAVINYAFQDVFFGDQFFWAGTQWFNQILNSKDFYITLLRSLTFSCLILLIEVPLGIYVALKMPKKGFSSSVYIILISIPLLIPWFVVGATWRIFIDSDAGLLGHSLSLIGINYDIENTYIAWLTILLMDAWHWTSLVVLLAYAGLSSIPESYYQAARIDGASQWSIFRFIQIPKIKRLLLIAVLLRFMDSLMIYIEPFIVTKGGPNKTTTFISHDLVQTATYEFNLGEGGATSVIYFLIILACSWALYKIIINKDE